MPRRYLFLLSGLILAGTGVALMVEARLGLSPWDVFHEAVAERTGLPLGQVVILTGVVVLAAWWPLRQRPGIGTLINVLSVGLVIDLVMAHLEAPSAVATQWVYLAVGLGTLGLGTAAYLSAGLGAGPRDGLMVGFAARGKSVRVVRTLVEFGALITGFVLGGTLGAGTVVFALAIGPVIEACLVLLAPVAPVAVPGVAGAAPLH